MFICTLLIFYLSQHKHHCIILTGLKILLTQPTASICSIYANPDFVEDWCLARCDAVYSYLREESSRFLQTGTLCQSPWCHIPNDRHCHIHHHENLQSTGKLIQGVCKCTTKHFLSTSKMASDFGFKCTPNRVEVLESGVTYMSCLSGRWHCMNERLVTNILRPIHFPETKCNNQSVMQHHIPKEQRPQLHCCKAYKLTGGVAVPGCSNISWVTTKRPDKLYILFQEAKLANYLVTKHSAESQGLLDSEDEGPTMFRYIRIPAYHTSSQPNLTQPNPT